MSFVIIKRTHALNWRDDKSEELGRFSTSAEALEEALNLEYARHYRPERAQIYVSKTGTGWYIHENSPELGGAPITWLVEETK